MSDTTKRIRVFVRETRDVVYELDVPVDYDPLNEDGQYPWDDQHQTDTSLDDSVVGNWEEIEPTPEPLYVLRLYDMFDGWMDIGEPCSKADADAAWAERTDNGTRKTSFADGDYFKVFPAGTHMVFTAERTGR